MKAVIGRSCTRYVLCQVNFLRKASCVGGERTEIGEGYLEQFRNLEKCKFPETYEGESS